MVMLGAGLLATAFAAGSPFAIALIAGGSILARYAAKELCYKAGSSNRNTRLATVAFMAASLYAGGITALPETAQYFAGWPTFIASIEFGYNLLQG